MGKWTALLLNDFRVPMVKLKQAKFQWKVMRANLLIKRSIGLF